MAIPARKPAKGGARPPWPLTCAALLAKLLPGLTSIGQMDCPTWAMAPLTGPLLPIPTPLSTGAIASPTESACAAGVELTAAATTAAVTMTWRTAVVDAAMTFKMLTVVFPVFDAGRRRYPALLIATVTSSPIVSLCT